MPRELGDLLTLKELQEERCEWAKHNFPSSLVPFMDLMEVTLGVAEEAGELAHAVQKWKQGIRGDAEKHFMEIYDASGDIIVYLAGVMENARRELERVRGEPVYGASLQDALEYAWAQVMNRDWKKNPTDGKVPSERSEP